MANLPTDMTSKANGAATEFRNKLQSGEHQLEKIAQRAGEQVGAIASDFASTTADTAKAGREYVQENPVKGVAIAAAAGVLAGSLLTIAMRSRKS